MGHSMGGIAGTYFVATFPDLIEKFISLDAIKQMSVPAAYTGPRLQHTIANFQRIVARMQKEATTFSYEEARERMIEAYGGSIGSPEADILLKRGLVKKGENKYCFSADMRTNIRYGFNI